MLSQAYPLPILTSSCDVVVSEDGAGLCHDCARAYEYEDDLELDLHFDAHVVHAGLCNCPECQDYRVGVGQPAIETPEDPTAWHEVKDSRAFWSGLTEDRTYIKLVNQAGAAFMPQTNRVCLVDVDGRGRSGWGPERVQPDAALDLITHGPPIDFEKVHASIVAASKFAGYVFQVKPRGENEGKYPALVERTDGATILYAGQFSTLFGEPGLGKSWVALMMAVDSMRNHDAGVIWLDFEDTPRLLADRAATIGALDLIQDSSRFKFLQPAIGDDLDALDGAREWASLQPQALVVIDSAEAAGCPSDGADVMPWLRRNIDPWVAAGCAVLLIDHVPKRKEDRPRGAIGSNRKLAHLQGAGLYLTGNPMTKATNGRLRLINHKDRRGDMETPVLKAVTTLVALWQEGKDGARTLTYKWEMPDAEDEGEDLAAQLLKAITAEGPAGVKGSRGVRGLVKGPYQEVDRAVNALLKDGRLERELFGKAFYYRAAQPPEEPRDEDEEAF